MSESSTQSANILLYSEHEIKHEVDMVIGPEEVQSQPYTGIDVQQNDVHVPTIKEEPVFIEIEVPLTPEPTLTSGDRKKSHGAVPAYLASNCLKEPPKKRRIWMLYERKDEKGEYMRLCRELASNEDRYFFYYNMSQSSYEQLHALVKPYIWKKDTNYREAIGSNERLAVCLRYLRTGEGFSALSRNFRIGRTTVSAIVFQVLKAIWKCLHATYMPKPTEDTWLQSERGFRELFDFPNCIGAINGKHITIDLPNNCRFKKKKSSSIVLLAIADPFYTFIDIDVGSYGQITDYNVFENSNFYSDLIHNKVMVPSKPLPGTTDLVPLVFTGGEGFSLKENLMRPFPKNITLRDPEKKRYNDNLSRVVRVVDDSFRMLADKWQVLSRPLGYSVEKSISIVKATCVLYNYVRVEHSSMLERPREIEKPRNTTMIRLKPTNQRSKNTAIDIRNKFVSYFNK